MVKISNVTVLGAGTMGHGIAQLCAQSGYKTVVVATRMESFKRAEQHIRRNLELFKQKGLLSDVDIEVIMSNLSYETNVGKAVKDADFVIESVTEDVEVKRRVLQEADANAPSHAIVCSNTSTIRISLLASFTKRPHMVIGTHFWNPPHIMPLVEIVKTQYTTDEVINITKAFIESLGKIPVVCKDTPGFLGVRLQAAIVLEAIRMLEEGIASAEDIDTAVKLTLGLRYPLFGPLRVVDLGGLDVFYNAYTILYSETGKEHFKPPELLKKKVEARELGIKTLKGFYTYTPEEVDKITRLRDEWTLDFLIKSGLLKVKKGRREG